MVIAVHHISTSHILIVIVVMVQMIKLMVVMMVMVQMIKLMVMVRSTWTDAMSAAVLSTRRFFTTAFFSLSDCFFKILFECFFISCILEAKW